MVNGTLHSRSQRFEATVGVLREAWDPSTVVHAVLGVGVEICSVPFSRCLHQIVASGVEIFVVHGEKERVGSGEGKGQSFHGEDEFGGHFVAVVAVAVVVEVAVAVE